MVTAWVNGHREVFEMSLSNVMGKLACQIRGQYVKYSPFSHRAVSYTHLADYYEMVLTTTNWD